MKANVKESKCYPCPRTPVTYVPNLYTRTPPQAVFLFVSLLPMTEGSVLLIHQASRFLRRLAEGLIAVIVSARTPPQAVFLIVLLGCNWHITSGNGLMNRFGPAANPANKNPRSSHHGDLIRFQQKGYFSITSMPPIKGKRTSGTRTLPSAC